MTLKHRIPVIGSAVVLPQVKFTTLDCARCGVIFAVTDEYDAQRRWDGGTFHCPNGHQNVFEGKHQELEKKIADLERREMWLSAEVDQERARAAAAVRSANATHGEMTKLRKRIANGVCPCCHRTFVNLQRHMATKHPSEAN